MKLSEKRKVEGMFECGVKKCDVQFRTGVGYIYHLNSTHGLMIDTAVKCRNFIHDLNSRLYGEVKSSNKVGYYVDKFNFATNR